VKHRFLVRRWSLSLGDGSMPLDRTRRAFRLKMCPLSDGVSDMAEVAILRHMFQEILRLIAELRPQPPPAPA